MVLVSLYEVIVKFLSRKKLGLSLGALIFSIVIIGPLLLPGYVLTLDMVFVPDIRIPRIALGGFWNSAIYRYPMHWLSSVTPGWLIQKGILIALFALLPVIAYRFLLPRSSPSLARILAAFFYAFNPFVYTRFLAGQWTILFAYALLPLVWHTSSLKEDTSSRWWRRPLLLGLALVLVFAFSLHLGVMALCICLAATVSTISCDHVRDYLRRTLVTVGSFIVGTLYWTLPALLRRGPSLVSLFDARHVDAFRTASDPIIGTAGNVLAMYGFWGEYEPWARQFIWAKDYLALWLITGGILAVLILGGIYRTVRTQETRRQGIVLLVLGILAFIFSCGAGETIFKELNIWLFTHIPFWDGFRDSQKWTAVLVLVYAYFIGQFSLPKVKAKIVGCILGVSAIVLYTFPMLFGFWGQLKPVWYPAEWYRINEILKQDPTCKAIFLPWHGYYTLKFNNDILTANTSRDFFDCEIIQSRQVEVGEIGLQGPIDPAYDAIEGLVTGKDKLSSEQINDLLKAANIHYVIFTSDLVGEDVWNYEFVKGLSEQKIGDTEAKLYRVK